MLVILSTTSRKFNVSQNDYSLTINKINIEGLSNDKNSKISNELNNIFYKNIFSIDRKEINKVISKYNIIEKHNVKKIYPSTINIKIKPTKFVARLSNNDQLIGANGKFIDNKENNEILPYIFGEFSSIDFLNLKNDIMESRFIFTKFKTLYFFPSKRWDILTNDGVLIKLPHGKISESLNLAYKIIISNDYKNKKLIDLRMSNHLIIK